MISQLFGTVLPIGHRLGAQVPGAAVGAGRMLNLLLGITTDEKNTQN